MCGQLWVYGKGCRQQLTIKPRRVTAAPMPIQRCVSMHFWNDGKSPKREICACVTNFGVSVEGQAIRRLCIPRSQNRDLGTRPLRTRLWSISSPRVSLPFPDPVLRWKRHAPALIGHTLRCASPVHRKPESDGGTISPFLQSTASDLHNCIGKG